MSGKFICVLGLVVCLVGFLAVAGEGAPSPATNPPPTAESNSLAAAGAAGQASLAPTNPVPELAAAAAPVLPALWFPVGERLVYSVHWGFLHVGETHVWSEWVEEDGRVLLAIRVRIQTVSFMDKIYPVNDFLESIVDPQTFLPLRFSKNLSEGRYRLKEVTTFDHRAGRAHWKHLLRENSTNDFEIKADTRDMLSFMYYMRRYDWKPETELTERVMADEKLYELIVHARKYENIELPHYGTVRSLLVEPDAKFKGVFIRVGRMKVWISDDQRCLCTQATAKIPVGSVRLMLQRVEGPGDDQWLDAAAQNHDAEGG